MYKRPRARGTDQEGKGNSKYLGVDADITVFGQTRVLMEGPELLQCIQVPIVKVLQSKTSEDCTNSVLPSTQAEQAANHATDMHLLQSQRQC